MTTSSKSNKWLIPVIIIIILLALSIAWTLNNKNAKDDSKFQIPLTSEKNTAPADNQTTETAQQSSQDTASAQNQDTVMKLEDIIEIAERNQILQFPSWLGKDAPDFTITDIQGKQHKLSQYKGKNVMLVFWATWCPPCRREIPHLIELQKSMGYENLEIMGISFVDFRNTENMIKSFVQNNSEINYDIFPVNYDELPAPFNAVQVLPTAFFITPQGKIKIATAGTLSKADMEMILKAQ